MHLEIPQGDFAGYIFDLDGTLVDTMPLHYQAWCDTFREFGYNHDIDEAVFYSLGGVSPTQVAVALNLHHGTDFNPAGLGEAKERKFALLLGDASLIAPVVDFARMVARTHPVSVASGGPREVVLRTLNVQGLAPLFPVVVTADDVANGKPAPDTFLLAAQRMGVKPEGCLVFEDADLGIQAAESAGMRWVKVSRPT